jgi:hypothetical protein
MKVRWAGPTLRPTLSLRACSVQPTTAPALAHALLKALLGALADEITKGAEYEQEHEGRGKRKARRALALEIFSWRAARGARLPLGLPPRQTQGRARTRTRNI